MIIEMMWKERGMCVLGCMYTDGREGMDVCLRMEGTGGMYVYGWKGGKGYMYTDGREGRDVCILMEGRGGMYVY